MAKTKLKAVAVTLAAAVSFSAQSQTPSSAGDVENAFSQCGIGAAIFQNNETAAIISNVIWDLGTTALSSQTSSPSSCSGANKNAAAFIYETLPSLEEDVVKGGGEHVAALLEVAGCEASNQAIVVEALQANYSESLSVESNSRLEKATQMGAALDQAMSLCNA